MHDRYYDSTDDRGNHSKSRTSTTLMRQKHFDIHKGRDELNVHSSSSKQLHSRNDLGTLKNEPEAGIRESGNRRYLAAKRNAEPRTDSSKVYSNAGNRHRQSDEIKKEEHSGDRRKRPLSATESERRGSGSTTASKKGKYANDDDANKRKHRHGDGSSAKSSDSKAADRKGKKAKAEQPVLGKDFLNSSDSKEPLKWEGGTLEF